MIDYKNISDSIDFYKTKGFVRVESPWTVTPEISNITKPEEAGVEWKIEHNGKVLVASAEQSFLYLYLKEFLPFGSFQSVTPCFRFENFDQLHTKYFIKNELIVTGNEVRQSKLIEIMKNATEFFKSKLSDKKITVVETKPRNTSSMKEYMSYDIVVEINGDQIELGSYGIRECSYLKWIYGTGCAEPRLSSIINNKL